MRLETGRRETQDCTPPFVESTTAARLMLATYLITWGWWRWMPWWRWRGGWWWWRENMARLHLETSLASEVANLTLWSSKVRASRKISKGQEIQVGFLAEVPDDLFTTWLQSSWYFSPPLPPTVVYFFKPVFFFAQRMNFGLFGPLLQFCCEFTHFFGVLLQG